MKNNLLLIGFFLICCSCTKKDDSKPSPSQNTVADSSAIYIIKASDKKLSQKERLLFAEKGYRYISSRENTYQTRASLNKMAAQLYSLKQPLIAKNAVAVVIERSLAAKDSTNVALAYNIVGNQYLNANLKDSAYYFLLKSEKLFSRKKDSIALGGNYLDKAFVQLYASDYSGCELSSIQALSYFKNSDQWQKQYEAFNLIGISSNELKNYDNAIIYHRKALEMVNRYPVISNSKIHFRSSSYNNLGYVYQNLNRNQEAIANFRRGLQENDLKTDNPDIYSALVDNLAYSKFKLKDYKDLPELFYESLKIRKANQLTSGVVASNLHLAEFFSSQGDTIKAKAVALEALVLSKESGVSGNLLASLKQLSAIDLGKASEYSSAYIRISDSLQTEERIAKDKFARIAFETDEIITEKDKLAEQNRNLLYVFGTILLFGILLYVIRYQRGKNRELLLVQAQQKANEDIYNLMISQQSSIEESRVKEKKRIAQELHDGVLGRLFGARLNLDSLNKFSDEDSVNSRFNYLNELKNIEQDIREISHDLNREKYVLINNFVAILNNLIEEQKNSHKANVVCTIDESIKWDIINNTIKINLYRIVQESLQNINKYADAKHITVSIKKEDETILLRITDDGIGFDLNIRKKGIGLQNMQSRALECNGALDVKSKKGRGTIIKIAVPIAGLITS